MHGIGINAYIEYLRIIVRDVTGYPVEPDIRPDITIRLLSGIRYILVSGTSHVFFITSTQRNVWLIGCNL